MVEVLLLALSHCGSQRGVAEQDVVLVIEFEAAAIHVGGSDQRYFTVQGQGFGMQQSALVFEDSHAGVQQIGVVAAARRGDDPRVVPGREDNAGVHAAMGSRAGGAMQVDARDNRGTKTLHRFYTFDVAVADSLPLRYAGSRVYVRFEHPPSPLLGRWLDAARRLLLHEIGA